MGSGNSVSLPDSDVESICNETGFTRKELQCLYQRFRELQQKKPPGDYLSRNDLLSVREVGMNQLGERLVDVIVEDYGESNKLNFRQFATVLSRFRRGKGTSRMSTKENKLLFLFSIYDRNHDSKIDREELLEILKLLVGGNINEDQIAAIADHTIQELDSDGDLTITFEEFCETLAKIDIDEKMSMKFST